MVMNAGKEESTYKFAYQSLSLKEVKNTSLSVLYVNVFGKSMCIFTTNMYMYLYLFMSFCKMWLYIFGRVA